MNWIKKWRHAQIKKNANTLGNLIPEKNVIEKEEVILITEPTMEQTHAYNRAMNVVSLTLGEENQVRKYLGDGYSSNYQPKIVKELLSKGIDLEDLI